MFAWWGRAVGKVRWWVIATALALVVLGATWGAGVFGALTGGGYDDPHSEANRTAAAISAELGQHDPDLVVLWSSPSATVDDPAFRSAVDALRGRPEVRQLTSWFDTRSPAFLSTDRHATYAAVYLRATGADAKMKAYQALQPSLSEAGLKTEVGGVVGFAEQSNAQTKKDISRAEVLSLPVLLILLILIFGGLIAALSPLVIGGIAILGAFVAVRLLTYVTDISVFAINVITLLGLGMAVDYSLFVVSRFREELAKGKDVSTAIGTTVATAGRTVVVSGLTIVLALSSLLIFPQPFLGGMAIGGMAAVLVAMLAALTVLPAGLSLLGHRIDALRVPLPRLSQGQTWGRIAHAVMRRPVFFVVGVLVVLAAFALPFTKVQWGGFDERVLPADTPARVVQARLADEFPGATGNPVQVLVQHAPASGLANAIRALPGVADVRVTQDALITVRTTAPPTSAGARNVVTAIRGLPRPAGATVLVGGRAAAVVDLLDSLRARLPWMALIMAAATMVLLFLAFGSVVLPIKAVLMNLVSIGASFGVVVWIFQDGHLEDLLHFQSTGYIEPSNMILVLAVLFGLATDYEVFLLSRIREEWDRTGDNTDAVATGLQHTGRIITAAALLLIVVVAGFATGGVTVVKTIGVGMIVAIIVDATLVRALLVPATMRLLGRWNWWAPGVLGRFYARYGIHEASPPSPEPQELAPV
jgi:trehalose monomycolate/heme transporter